MQICDANYKMYSEDVFDKLLLCNTLRYNIWRFKCSRLKVIQ